MSFYLEHTTLRSGNTYNLKTRPEMSAQDEQSTAASEPNLAERISKTNADFSDDSIEDRIKANLEPIHAQITVLAQMMDKLIKDNSAKAYSTASTTSEGRFASESMFTD